MGEFKQGVTVRWADLDPNGHVRHSVYYDYGALARVAFLESNGVGPKWLAAAGIGPVLFREEARFMRELHMGDQLTIDFQVAGLTETGKRWRIRHNLVRNEEELTAVLEMDGAWLDLKKRKVVEPPQELAVVFSSLPKTDDFEVLQSGKN
ncbi:MAG: thioesterase family protein [Gammaproteobacteria bacterium]|nr:thioesterase family protein [Gammaproteobacteria bacterium]